MRPRPLLTLGLLALLPLPGCAALGEYAGVDLVAVPIMHRSIEDAAVSLVTGRNCSVVRLDQGKPYCQAREPPPPPPPYCTRSLARVDCWSDPQDLPDHPRRLADGPYALSPSQEAARTARWPW